MMVELDEDFEEVFLGCGGGSPVIECGCGRKCYAEDSRHYEAGELERLQEMRSLQPRRYEEFAGAETVSGYEILGRMYVYGCPCDYAKMAQKALWRHREQILQYISRRNRRELERAKENARRVAELEGEVRR